MLLYGEQRMMRGGPPSPRSGALPSFSGRCLSSATSSRGKGGWLRRMSSGRGRGPGACLPWEPAPPSGMWLSPDVPSSGPPQQGGPPRPPQHGGAGAAAVAAAQGGGGGAEGLLPAPGPPPPSAAGAGVTAEIREAARGGVDAVWMAAAEARRAVRRAGGLPEEARREDLALRARLAENQLRAALAELRLVRAEMRILAKAEAPSPGLPKVPRPPLLSMEPGFSRSSPWSTQPQLSTHPAAFSSTELWDCDLADAFSSGEECIDCGSRVDVHYDMTDRNWYCAQCWFDCYGSWPPTHKKIEPKIVLGKYEVHPHDVLGQGGFSIVRRGRNIETGEIVAVKSYAEMETLDKNDLYYAEDQAFFLEKFLHEVDTFEKLHAVQNVKGKIVKELNARTNDQDRRASWYVPDGLDSKDKKMMGMFTEIPDTDQVFIRLVDYSKDAAGRPAAEEDTDECCVVLELADYTLDEYLQDRQDAQEVLSVDEVHHIFHQLAQVIAALHAKEFVHCDLKPANVMHFPSGRWKLIDMDGIVTTGQEASLADVFYTSLYCSPEFAKSVTEARDVFEVSRLLDVWSLGMLAIELVTLKPLLLEKYYEYEEAGMADKFINFVADPNSVIEVPPAVTNLDPQLADLIGLMLHRDRTLRPSMVEVLLHPFFTGKDSGGARLTLEKTRRSELLKAKESQVQAPRRASRVDRTVVKKRMSCQVVNVPFPSPRALGRIMATMNETSNSSGSENSRSPGNGSRFQDDPAAPPRRIEGAQSSVVEPEPEGNTESRFSVDSAFSDVSDAVTVKELVAPLTAVPEVSERSSEPAVVPYTRVDKAREGGSAPWNANGEEVGGMDNVKARPGLPWDDVVVAASLNVPQVPVIKVPPLQVPTLQLKGLVGPNSTGTLHSPRGPSPRPEECLEAANRHQSPTAAVPPQAINVKPGLSRRRGWSEVSEKVRDVQERFSKLCTHLRNREAAASGMEAVLQAASEAEAMVWQGAAEANPSLPPPPAGAESGCAGGGGGGTGAAVSGAAAAARMEREIVRVGKQLEMVQMDLRRIEEEPSPQRQHQPGAGEGRAGRREGSTTPPTNSFGPRPGPDRAPPRPPGGAAAAHGGGCYRGAAPYLCAQATPEFRHVAMQSALEAELSDQQLESMVFSAELLAAEVLG